MSDTSEKNIIKLYAMTDGKLIGLEEIDDITFASKMMGRGFAIRPTNGKVLSPVDGIISDVFPMNHVIGFKAESLELLLHMGINTVKIAKKAFHSAAIVDNKVNSDSLVATVDLELINQPDMSDDMIVIFINGNEVIDYFEMYDLDKVHRGQEIGYVVLK